MKFIKYPKIHRLGKEEVEGILEGDCFVQEKIDGANVSIWLNDGEMQLGSRNQHLNEGTDFNGFVKYAKDHKGIKAYLKKNPTHRLYLEWLVRHTIQYNELAYRKAYLFDIVANHKKMNIYDVYKVAKKYKIETPKLFGYIHNPTEEQLKELVGQSEIGEKGEGVVIKNHGFVNKFCRCEYAKIVTEKFKESNAITFGGNNKHSESYWEIYVTNKYVTLGRVQKIVNKTQSTIDEKLDMKHIPRIINTVYNDLLTEEIWSIQKKVPKIDFNKLKRFVLLKAKQVYIDILNGDISVADKKDE